METKGRFLAQAATKWYKPCIIRVPGLLLVFGISLALIGVLEYATRTLPSAVKKSHIPTFAPSLPPANKRQIEPFSSSPFPPQPTTTPHAYVSTIGISTSNQIFVTSATSSGAYVMTASTCTPSAPPSVTSVAAYVKMPWITSTLVEDSTSSSTCSNSGDTVILSWPLWKVFVGGYLPVFLAILFKVFWTSIYANVKLIEPFIQLSRPGGASAKDAFSTCYLSNNLTPVPVIALFNGRWLMFWTSIVYLIVGFLPPLASESLFRDTNYNCSNPNPAQSQNPCWPRLSMDPTIIRLLQGLLSFVAIITLTIMYMVFRSSTGITSDPSSIAFVACLIHHPDVLANFRRITDQESDEDIKSLFAKKFYQLRTYLGSDGVERYGIVPCSPAHLLEDSIGTTHAPEENKARKTKTSKNFLDISFVIFILGILGVIISYFKDGANDSFNRFFNSNSFGPRFFMSAMGSIISMNLKRLEREVQTLSPFHRLAQAPSSAGSIILLRKYNVPFTAFVISFAQGYIFSASIAFIAILAEILVVVLAAIPYSPGKIFLELLICTYTSIGILSLMVIVLISLVFWRRKLPYLPRMPDTLGGVISYLCDSHMLDDFDECKELGNRELEKMITRFGKKYRYGKYTGVDGQVRWMIEEGTVLPLRRE